MILYYHINLFQECQTFLLLQQTNANTCTVFNICDVIKHDKLMKIPESNWNIFFFYIQLLNNKNVGRNSHLNDITTIWKSLFNHKLNVSIRCKVDLHVLSIYWCLTWKQYSYWFFKHYFKVCGYLCLWS